MENININDSNFDKNSNNYETKGIEIILMN